MRMDLGRVGLLMRIVIVMMIREFGGEVGMVVEDDYIRCMEVKLRQRHFAPTRFDFDASRDD